MATAVVTRETPITAGDLARNLQLVRAAIDLIASGGANRVTLVGLRGAERTLPGAQSLSLAAGLRARAAWHASDDGCDITLEGLR
jgi:hypothetical protein